MTIKNLLQKNYISGEGIGISFTDIKKAGFNIKSVKNKINRMGYSYDYDTKCLIVNSKINEFKGVVQ